MSPVAVQRRGSAPRDKSNVILGMFQISRIWLCRHPDGQYVTSQGVLDADKGGYRHPNSYAASVGFALSSIRQDGLKTFTEAIAHIVVHADCTAFSPWVFC